MEARPFGGFNTRPSPWGYNWTTENSTDYRASPISKDSSAQNSPTSNTTTSSPEPQMMANQYANMPAALLTSLKRDKKPFTYTPGGVNLSEVLNARLQKRLERKKRYSEERMADKNANPIESLPKFDPPKQVIVMPTYNSPLDMYSMENALEALEVQAELVAADKSLGSPSRSATLPRNHKFDDKDFDSNKGVAQSKAFRVLQIITDTDEDPHSKGRGGGLQEEMRFTGLRDSKAIPSRFFQTLQKITGTDEEQDNEETAKSAVFEKQSGFQQQRISQPQPGYKPQQFAPSQVSPLVQNNTYQQQQPVANQRVVSFQEPSGLKRPAAFLPMKTGGDPLSRVKPVHPPFLTNGPRKIFNQSGGTDF